MQIENLEVGMELKNYKELCEVLGLPLKTGNAKKSQMKEIERHAQLEKNRYAFIVKEIYKVPLPPNNNITQYTPLIEKLIMHVIVTQSKRNVLYINKSTLYETIKLINEEYSNMKYKRIKLSELNHIPKEVIDDFYNTSDKLLERNVEQALKSLFNQSLIKSNEVFSVCQYVTDKKSEINTISKLKYVHRRATKDETALILKLQRDALGKFKCYELKEIYDKGLSFEFYKVINDYLFENHNIKYYYNSYELIFNIKHIKKAYADKKLYEMDEESFLLTSTLLNNNVSDKIVKMAEDRVEKTKSLPDLSKLQFERLNENYITNIKKLVDDLIHPKP
jgi:hypothetical protein